MAKKKSTKSQLKKIKKNNPALYVVIVVLLFIIGVLVTYIAGAFDPVLPESMQAATVFHRTQNANSGNNGGSTGGNTGGNGGQTPTDKEDGVVENIIYTDFQIHFMTLGNASAGDSVYIKAGDTDVLIDAGAELGSYATTSAYVNKYCKDGKLEYCIATHGDADHIAAFPKFFQNYQIDTVIDFTSETSEQFANYYSDKKKSVARNYFCGTTKTTATYENYLKAREQYAAHHYTAGDCFKNKNGAQATYQLSEYVTMTILYNYYYYDNDINNKIDTSDENNVSVCTLFTYKKGDITQNFLLTGDLEKEGEAQMANYYNGSTPEKTLPQVELFKAGHHGSKTSSNTCLLQIIKPKMCVVSCCCGTDEYTGVTANQFPTQEFIDRIAPYTDRVYVTTIFSSYEVKTAQTKSEKTGVAVGKDYIHTSGFKPMNGNVCVSSGEGKLGLWASNNLIKLKDSEWFNSKVTLNGVEINVRTRPRAWS